MGARTGATAVRMARCRPPVSGWAKLVDSRYPVRLRFAGLAVPSDELSRRGLEAYHVQQAVLKRQLVY